MGVNVLLMNKITSIFLLLTVVVACTTSELRLSNDFPPIYFEENIDTFNNKQKQVIDSIGNYLVSNTNSKIDIIGSSHPSEDLYQTEDDSDNLALKRILNVANYLIANYDIAPARISYVEAIIGPQLGQNPNDFIVPEDKEFRKVSFTVK